MMDENNESGRARINRVRDRRNARDRNERRREHTAGARLGRGNRQPLLEQQPANGFRQCTAVCAVDELSDQFAHLPNGSLDAGTR